LLITYILRASNRSAQNLISQHFPNVCRDIMILFTIRRQMATLYLTTCTYFYAQLGRNRWEKTNVQRIATKHETRDIPSASSLLSSLWLINYYCCI